MSTRLGRSIDRARIIERRIPQVDNETQQQLLRGEATSLWRRIDLINWAIRLCVSGALTVCLVIVALFIGDFVAFNLSVAIAVLFVIAMPLIISSLVFLLREISVSTQHLRQGMEIALEDSSQQTPAAGG